MDQSLATVMSHKEYTMYDYQYQAQTDIILELSFDKQVTCKRKGGKGMN